MVDGISRRALLISKGWVQAVLLVVLFGFFVLGLLAYRTYQAKPPTPERVVDPQGELLYTGEDVRSGQQVFLHNGLMEYGSVFGHGAYLGPDFTADYLRRSSDFVRDSYGGAGSDTAARRTIEDFRTNRYDEASGTLELTAPQAEAHRRLVDHYSRFFSEPTTKHGLRKEAITDETELRQLTAFFGWTAWAGSTNRPGHNYSYTNNWPPEPRVDNRPTANVIVWSVLSLIALLGGIGILFAAFGRWQLPRLARPRAGEPVVPHARRRGADAGPAGLRVVLLRDGGAVPDPDVRRRRLAALPGGPRELLRLRPGGDLPLQPDAHVARAARDLLGRDLVRRRRHLPGADDRPARAQAPGQAGVRAAGRAGGGGVRHADRLVPRHPRRARGRRVELVRAAGLRVPRPRAAVAGAAVDRARRSGWSCCSACCADGCAASTRATCRGCSSSPRARSRPSTPSG